MDILTEIIEVSNGIINTLEETGFFNEHLFVEPLPLKRRLQITMQRKWEQENEMLFNAVCTLTTISKAADFDISIFNAMDKVCQMIYNKYIASR